VNVALTVVSAVIVTTQSPVPLHPLSLHPAKRPVVDVAVSVTTVPEG
jgi:hypothetical protein